MDSLHNREYEKIITNEEWIDFLFEQNPELYNVFYENLNHNGISIQTEKIINQQVNKIYNEYLYSIYNNYQLVFRWDIKNLENFHYSEQIKKIWWLNINNLKFWSGIYLTNNKWMANNFAQQNNGQIYICMINKDNINSFQNREEYNNFIKKHYNIERVTTLDRDNYTKYLHSQNKILHIKNNGDWNEEFIGNMKNLHILWSQRDREWFKQFIKQRNTKIENQLIENLKTNP